ncbi:hypothetical protein V495_06188 [Pseudogymnoascus sp. VKM F-4514 (FW-929)]|nr:hypothetical protein V495_06188 [Pseudogymnoascus sp. VKM F-4514 (FW-929)]
MSKFGVLVMGPAGAGKTTFCSSLITHLHHNRRSSFYINLDPAAETFDHEPDLDIKDLISLSDVMEEMRTCTTTAAPPSTSTSTPPPRPSTMSPTSTSKT